MTDKILTPLEYTDNTIEEHQREAGQKTVEVYNLELIIGVKEKELAEMHKNLSEAKERIKDLTIIIGVAEQIKANIIANEEKEPKK